VVQSTDTDGPNNVVPVCTAEVATLTSEETDDDGSDSTGEWLPIVDGCTAADETDGQPPVVRSLWSETEHGGRTTELDTE